MKVRTQISLGYLSLAALLIVVAVYFMLNVRSLNRINQSLTNIDSQARKLEIQQLELLIDLFDYDLKYLATRDVDYLTGMGKLEQQYERDFASLTRLISSPKEQKIAEKIQTAYGAYKNTFQEQVAAGGQPAAETLVALDHQKYDLAQDLKKLYADLELSTYAIMQLHLSESDQARARVQKIALATGALSIGFAIALSILLAGRISSPLGKLMAGTRKIASGEFDTAIPMVRRDEFGELAEAFNSMARKLAELDELKKGIISQVSHELKSPLASLQETLELLVSETLGPLNERQGKLVAVAREKTDLLSRRISDLLDMSRMEAGVMEYYMEPVDVSSLVRSTVESAAPLLREKNLAVVSDFNGVPMEATIDSTRIVQVVENLMSNAIKFSNENSFIRVGCRRAMGPQLGPVLKDWSRRGTSQQGDPQRAYVVISVEDDGVGIAPEETKQIFEKFYQAQAGNEVSRAGTGLGLAICRNIVEAHDGVIWVESQPRKGSRFHFALPTSLPRGLRESRQGV
jgi:two-component system sensor histidine kinase GlrK